MNPGRFGNGEVRFARTVSARGAGIKARTGENHRPFRGPPSVGVPRKRLVNRSRNAASGPRASLGTHRYQGSILNEKTGTNRPAFFVLPARPTPGRADQKGLTMFILEIIGAIMVALSLCALLSQDAGISR